MKVKSLPIGWGSATIGELVGPDGVFVDGDWVESKDQNPDGDVRLIQLADVGDGKYLNRSSRFLTSESAAALRCTFLMNADVLIARMPDPLGRACIFPGDTKRAVTVVDVCIVRTGRIGADHRWLICAINAPDFRDAVASLQSGSTRKRISRGNLSTLILPVPPLGEQARIADEVEKQFTRLDAAVGALKRVQANLKHYRAAVLKAACEGRLVSTEAELARRENRPYEPASALLDRIFSERRSQWEFEQLGSQKSSKGKFSLKKWEEEYAALDLTPEHSTILNEGWVWTTVKQLGEVQLGRQRSPKNRSRNYPTKYIRAANITEKGIDVTDLLDMEFTPRERERYLLASGDIVLSEASGSPKQVGKPAIWRNEVPICCFQNTVIRLRSFFHASEYLLVVFKNYYWNGHFAKIAGGVGINHLGAEKFSSIPVPVPPLSEQERIVAEVERRLSVMDEVEMQVEFNLKRADRLREAILKRAFEGKLVPQDPSDEPASILLSRIASEPLGRTSALAHHPRGKGAVLPMPKTSGRERIPIVEVLRGAKSEMSPEDLLNATGYEADSIDDFYAELKSQVDAGLVKEIRSGDKIAIRASQK